MFKGIARPQNHNFIQVVIAAAVLIGLFFVGFQVSSFIFAPASQPAVPTAPAAVSTGGIAQVNPPHRLNDFTLTSKSGTPISLSSLRGKVVTLFFGYTHCPDECPTTLSDYTRVKKALGDQADQVDFVFVSVDGARDTPAQMTTFLNQFDTSFIGMTGTETQLRSLGTEYGLMFQKENISAPSVSDDAKAEAAQPGDHHDASATETALDAQNYFVQHTSPTFLIDRNGALRMVAFYRTAPDALTSSIRQLLAAQ